MGIKIPSTPTPEDLTKIQRAISQVPIRETKTNDAIKSLGLWYSPDWKSRKLEKFISQKNRDFIKIIIHTTMEPRRILQAYTKKHLPAIV